LFTQSFEGPPLYGLNPTGQPVIPTEVVSVRAARALTTQRRDRVKHRTVTQIAVKLPRTLRALRGTSATSAVILLFLRLKGNSPIFPSYNHLLPRPSHITLEC